MKGGVKQEPGWLEDRSPETSTQSDIGDVSSNPEGTLLDQLQTRLKANNDKNMVVTGKIVKLNTAEVSLSISKVENRLVNSVATVADNMTSDMRVKFDEMNVKFSE